MLKMPEALMGFGVVGLSGLPAGAPRISSGCVKSADVSPAVRAGPSTSSRETAAQTDTGGPGR